MWTYSGDPSETPKDAVRFGIGDTDVTDPLLQDEEINYLIVQCTDIDEAAVFSAQTIGAKYARLADKSIGDLKTSHSQKSKQYFDLADRIQAKLSVLAVPYAGGLSRGEKLATSENTDFVKPSFKRDMQNYPGDGTNNGGWGRLL